MTATVLTVAGLTVALRDDGGRELPVLRDVDLDVRPGEVVGIVGETGAGKSMTARSILGLIPTGATIESGTIRLGDADLRDPVTLREARGTSIGYVPQNPRMSINPVFTIGAQLRAVIRRHRKVSRREAWDDARALLEKVRIPDSERVMRSYAHQLSGGLCQRACIAIALANDPLLVIADEPTTGLDVTVQRQILDLFRAEIQGTGRGGVIVTHDLGVVANWCDRVAVMYAGSVVAFGDVETMIHQPAHPYAAGLVRIATALEKGEEPQPVPGSVPAFGEAGEGCAFAPRCAQAVPECSEVAPEPRVAGRQVFRCHRPLIEIGSAQERVSR